MRAAMAALCALWTLPAVAEVERFAVVVSAPRGFAHEPALRFADGDAVRMADVLGSLGGFPAENTVVLHGPSPMALRRTLISINARVRAAADRGAQVMLVVYFSGHGDAVEIHLGHEGFAMDELRELLLGSAATFRVLVVDACGSGGLTGIKGATPAEPFVVSLEDRLPGQGFAIVTSASANEAAQESERWGGSVFTSALVSALSGAADVSLDGEVTLHEAYQYAYESTLRSTRGTMVGPQHPTFEYDLRGRGSVTLTRPGQSVERAQVLLAAPASWWFLDETDHVVLEASFTRGHRVVRLPVGRYRVEVRARDVLRVGELSLSAGPATTLWPEDLRALDYAESVRKGATESGWAWSVGALGGVVGPQARVLPVRPTVGAVLDVHLATSSASLLVSTAGGRLGGVLPGDGRTLDLGLALTLPLVFDALTARAGVEGGAIVLWQSFDPSSRATPARTSIFGRAGPLVGLDWAAGGGWSLALRASLSVELARVQADSTSPPALEVGVVPRVGLAVVFTPRTGAVEAVIW